jgi:two-component system, LytTR family, sensor kinase
VMRYATQPPETDGKVDLVREKEHIENLIYIYNIRFPGRCFMQFEHPPIPGELRIVPLMLVTLAENAFKHGEYTEADKPITLQLKLSGNQLIFITHNWKRNWDVDPGESVGRENISRRLELLYPGKHSYIWTEDDHTYTTRLTVDL